MISAILTRRRVTGLLALRPISKIRGQAHLNFDHWNRGYESGRFTCGGCPTLQPSLVLLWTCGHRPLISISFPVPLQSAV